MKWIAPLLVYLAVGIGLFQFHSAWGALVGFHAAIVLSLFIARPDIPVPILFKSKNIKWIVLSVLLCGSSGVTLYFLWEKFGFVSDLSAQVEALGLTSSTWIPFIVYFALANPFLEEYFWRGDLGSEAKGLRASDFVFSGYHALILIGKMQAGSVLFGVTALVLAGWFWRQLLRKDRGLLAPVLGHLAADLTILMAIYLKVQ